MRYFCIKCNKPVEYKDRGFLFFCFWPWTIFFMKKKCQICNLNVVTNEKTNSRKRQVTCAILSLFMLHRFYLGRHRSGIIQLLTGGGFIIWWVIDCIDIYKCEIKDSNGNTLIEYF